MSGQPLPAELIQLRKHLPEVVFFGLPEILDPLLSQPLVLNLLVDLLLDFKHQIACQLLQSPSIEDIDQISFFSAQPIVLLPYSERLPIIR